MIKPQWLSLPSLNVPSIPGWNKVYIYIYIYGTKYKYLRLFSIHLNHGHQDPNIYTYTKHRNTYVYAKPIIKIVVAIIKFTDNRFPETSIHKPISNTRVYVFLNILPLVHNFCQVIYILRRTYMYASLKLVRLSHVINFQVTQNCKINLFQIHPSRPRRCFFSTHPPPPPPPPPNPPPPTPPFLFYYFFFYFFLGGGICNSMLYPIIRTGERR